MTDNQTATGVDLESVAESTAALNELAGAAERAMVALEGLRRSLDLRSTSRGEKDGDRGRPLYAVGRSEPVSFA